MIVWSGFTESEPWSGRPSATSVSGSPSGSLSFTRTGTFTGVLAGVVAASSWATGEWSARMTWTVTCAWATPPSPSLIW